MRTILAKPTAHAVRDELEQALYCLPRLNENAEHIALLIEEAIEIAMEMELSRPKPPDDAPYGRDGEKP